MIGLIKNIWYYFRIGYSNYIGMTLSGINFVIISYSFIVEENALLKGVFPNVLYFLVPSILALLIISSISGKVHILKQASTDQSILTSKNPVIMEILERVKKIEEKV